MESFNSSSNFKRGVNFAVAKPIRILMAVLLVGLLVPAASLSTLRAYAEEATEQIMTGSEQVADQQEIMEQDAEQQQDSSSAVIDESSTEQADQATEEQNNTESALVNDKTDETVDKNVSNEDADSIKITLTTESGVVKTETAGTEVTGATWDKVSSTLTLNGLDITAESNITQLSFDDSLENVTISLSGENKFYGAAPSSGWLSTISCANKGTVNISGDGSLLIDTSSLTHSKGVEGIYVVTGALNITDGANVTVKTATSTTTSNQANYGVYVRTGAFKLEKSSLSIVTGNCQGMSWGLNVTSDITVSNSSLSISNGTAAGTRNVGIFTNGKLTFSGSDCKAEILANTATGSNGKSIGIWLNDNDQELTISDKAYVKSTSSYASSTSSAIQLDKCNLVVDSATLEVSTFAAAEESPSQANGIVFVQGGSPSTAGTCTIKNSSLVNINIGKTSSDAYGLYLGYSGSSLSVSDSILNITTDTGAGTNRCILTAGESTITNSVVSLTAGSGGISEGILLNKIATSLTVKNSELVITASDATRTSGGIAVAAGNVVLDGSAVTVKTGKASSSDSGDGSFGIGATTTTGTQTLTVNNGSDVNIATGESATYNDGIYFNNNITITGAETNVTIKASSGNASHGIYLNAPSSVTELPSLTISDRANVNVTVGTGTTVENGIFATNANVSLNDSLDIACYVTPATSDITAVNVGVEKSEGFALSPTVSIPNISNTALINCSAEYNETTLAIQSISALNSSDAIYLFNGLVCAGFADQKGEGWVWDADTLTLKLNGANLDGIGTVWFALEEGETANIVLENGSVNTINKLDTVGAAYGIYSTGSLNISGNGTLNIVNQTGNLAKVKNIGICIKKEASSEASLTISEEANVVAYAGSALSENTTSSVGVIVEGDFAIKDNAKLASIASSPNISAALVTTENITITGKPELSLFADGNSDTAYAALAGLSSWPIVNASNLTSSTANSSYIIAFTDGINNYDIVNCVETSITDTMTQKDYSAPVTVSYHVDKGDVVTPSDSTAKTGDFAWWILILMAVLAASGTCGYKLYKKQSRK